MKVAINQFSNRFKAYTILLVLWFFPGVLLGIKYTTYFLHWLIMFLLGAAYWKANYEAITDE